MTQPSAGTEERTAMVGPAPRSDIEPAADAERITECIAELHALTKLPRIGWVLAGVQDPERVAMHCYETAVIACILSRYVTAAVDIGKVLTMALFHEVGEVRLTDLPRRAAPYVREAKDRAESEITQDVLRGVADDIGAIVEEFHDRKSVEARLTEAAEELQIIFAAMMYAKERNGDMSEYRRDAAKYDSYGLDIAEQVAVVLRDRLERYLGDHPSWEIGYRRTPETLPTVSPAAAPMGLHDLDVRQEGRASVEAGEGGER
jgi:putative hydrolase of HD superfamily